MKKKFHSSPSDDYSIVFGDYSVSIELDSPKRKREYVSIFIEYSANYWTVEERLRGVAKTKVRELPFLDSSKYSEADFYQAYAKLAFSKKPYAAMADREKFVRVSD